MELLLFNTRRYLIQSRNPIYRCKRTSNRFPVERTQRKSQRQHNRQQTVAEPSDVAVVLLFLAQRHTYDNADNFPFIKLSAVFIIV